jgi:hypothetical protein
MIDSSELRERADYLREQFPQRRYGTPPQETGERLATLPRARGEELRINWAVYEGRPYVSTRLWTQDEHGGWWPSKTCGCTIRLRGLAAAEAIAAAMDLAEAHHAEEFGEGVH